MSKTVDERVVEMRFDNAQFERNVQTSMSTIDKLKQKLNFSGASKGLENINSEAKKVSFSNMESSLASLEKRFSTTGIIGMSMIHNLTSSAMNFVSKVNSFVTGGIVNGGITRAMNLENAQFQLKGLLNDADAVTAVMKNVNDAVDGTAYSLDAAATVASQLAASGMKAGDQMFSSLRAVAGVAAMTNSSYEDIGRIFTQVAGQGKLMGDQLLQLSGRGMNAAATLAKYLGKSEAEIRSMVSHGEIDFKTFANAMDDAFGEHAKKANETYTGAMSNVKASLARIGAEFVTPLIKSKGPLVNFFNALREKINDIKNSIGPFAKSVTGTVTKIINGITKSIKKLNIEKVVSKLSGIFKDNPFTKLSEKIDEVTKPAKKAATAVKDFGDVVNKVIRGDFGNGKARWDKLTKAGYDWAYIQNLVNEKLGDGTRHATKFKGAQTELNKSQSITVDQLVKMSDAQLKNLGFTESEIKAFRDLEEQSKKTGIPLKDLVDDIDKLSTENLILDSFKNAWDGLVKVFDTVKKAWEDIFPPKTMEERSQELYDIIAAIHNFSTKLIISDETADKLSRTFKGLFAVLDIVRTIAGGGLKIAFKLLKKLIESIKSVDLSEIGRNIIDGLRNGLSDGITSIPQILTNIGKSLLEAIKNVLGIHSPSTEMYDVGENTIAGLVNGIKDNVSKVLEELKNLGKRCINTIKNLDWGTVFAGGLSVVLVYIVKKIADAMDAISAPLNGLGSIFSSASNVISASTKNINKILKNTAKVVKSFSKVLTAKAWKMKAEAIRDLAISLAILAGAVYLLAQLDAGKLWGAVGAITVLAAVLAALAFAMSKMSDASVSVDKKGLNIKGIQSGLMQIGLAILAIAAAVKLMGSMDPEQAKQGFLGLAGIIVALGVLFAVFGTFVKGKSAQNIDKAGTMIQKMAVSLLLMALVTKLVGKLSKDEMIKGAEFAGAFVLFVGALALISRVTGKRTDQLSSMLLKISAAMILMVSVTKLAGSLSKDEMIKGAAFAAAFLIFVGILVKITKTNKDTEIAKIGGLLMAISASMLLMVGVVKLVGKLSPGEMIKGAIFVGAFLIFVAALVKITKVNKGTEIAKVSGTILAMSVAIGILAAVCIILGLIKISALAKGIVAIGMLGAIMSLMIVATKGAKDVKGSILAMAVAIGVMAASVAVLSFIKPDKLYGAVGALSILMTVFGMMAIIAGQAGKDSMAPLIIMVAAIVAIAISLGTLASLPFESLLSAAASLSMVMLSFAASMVIIGNLGKMSGKALASIAAMVLVVYLLGEILGHIVKMENIESALTVAESLSLLLLSLSVCCVILAAAGAGGPAALIGIGSLAVLVVAMGALITAIGALVTEFPKLEEFLNTGIPIMQKIGEGIGSFFGGIVKGFSSAVMQLIPELCAALSEFAVGIMPFIAVARTIDASVLEGIGYLSLAIVALSAANLIEGITSFLTFGSSFADLGAQLTAFIVGATPFLAAMSTIDPAVVESASTLADMIITLTEANLLSRITEFLGGDADFSSFGTQLEAFGKSLVSFSNAVKGNIDPEAVESAATAGLLMAKLQDALPRSGGWLQEIAGEKDLTAFGQSCAAFGKSIVQFCESVGTEGAINTEAAQAAADAGSIMAKLQDALPKTGGWIQEIAGEQDLTAFGNSCAAFGKAMTTFSSKTSVDEEAVTAAANAGKVMAELQDSIPEEKWFDGKISLEEFGEKIVAFGEGIVDYSDTVGDADLEAISSSIDQAKKLVDLTNSVSNLDTESISNFDNVESLATGIVNYSNAVEEINSNNIEAAIGSSLKLINLIPKLANLDTSGISKFNVSSLGESIKSYSDKVNGLKPLVVNSSITTMFRLKNLINSLANIDTSGVGSYVSAINKLGTVNVSEIAKAFSGASSKLSSAGSDMINGLIKGINSKKSATAKAVNSILSSINESIKSKTSVVSRAGNNIAMKLAAGISDKKKIVSNAISSCLNSTISDIKNDYYSKFYNTGSYLVSGFASGISDNSYKAKAKAKAMAKAAEQAARDELDINSPSRVFRAIGRCIPEGFAQGIERSTWMVQDSSVGMANAAVNELKSAMLQMSDIVDDDIDVQPTIRPVLDLSDVRSGAGAISGLFRMNPSIGVMANAGTISTMMNRRNQNGTTNDVVSALKDLKKTINNSSGNTYNVNGVTYDDGSNVSDAVQTLVRAARVERRK